MATDPPVDITDYDPEDLDRILGEAAQVLRIVGFAGHGLTIIGGLLPSLLVPVVDPCAVPIRACRRVASSFGCCRGEQDGGLWLPVCSI